MPGGFPYALTEAHRNAHRATQGGRGKRYYPTHERRTESRRGRTEPRPKNDRETHPEQHRRPNGSLFVHFSFYAHPKRWARFFDRDFSPFLEKALSASFLRKYFLLFLLRLIGLTQPFSSPSSGGSSSTTTESR